MSLDNPQRLSFVGPRDPTHGFPLWYEDTTGTRLALGVDGDPRTPAVGELPNPGAPLAFPTNFPEEGFYFLAESRMPIGGAGTVGRARLVLALEAAFGGVGTPAAGRRVVFARIRVRLDDVTPGASYVVTHPYGVTDPLPADDGGRVFVTDDRGLVEEQFDAVVRDGFVAPFLTWDVGAPAGYLGDGVTEHAVTGSPFGTNFFRVDGPRVADAGGPVDPGDPTNPDRIQSSLFTVQGRVATRLGVEVTAAHYTRTATATFLDVHATSAPGQTVELAGPGSPRTAFLGAGRAYTARAEGSTVPSEVTVVNATDVPATRATAAVTDLVTVTSAVHDVSAGTLSVSAQSSDATGPSLTVEEIGPLTADPTVFPGIAATAAEVVVTSSAGGRGRAPVALAGAALPALPLLADAGPDAQVVTGTTAELDGSSSRGEVTTWAWLQTAGPNVPLTGETTPRLSFSAPAAGASLTFSLTVTGPDGATDSDTVTVSVTAPPPPDLLTIDRAEFRTSRLQYRVSGTVTGALPNEVVVSFDGSELGRSPVDVTGAWDVRHTLTAAETALQPDATDSVTATSASATTSALVNVRN